MSWRLLTYKPDDAVHNMAIDEAVLESHLAGLVPPTLRLYAFKPHAVSLGYSQKISEANVDRFKNAGFDVVRRPTGGRAVLHDEELTYSFVASSGSDDDTVLGASIAEAYRQICSALLEAFESIGVRLELGAAGTAYKDMHDCFAATTNADLHFQGKKIVGSAQLRRKHAVLQHGSILLNQPQDLMGRLLRGDGDGDRDKDRDGVPSSAVVSGEAHHANLFEVLGREVSMEELSTALRYGFEKVFNVTLAEGGLTEQESQSVEDLLPKYQRISEQA